MSAARAKWMTVAEVAEHMAVVPKTVRNLLLRGRLRGAKVGNDWRVRPEDLDAWFRANANRRGA